MSVKELPASSNKEQEKKPYSTMDVVTHKVKKLGSNTLLRLNNKLEELFVTFCINYLESPERGGQLPKAYSELTQAEVKNLAQNPEAIPNPDPVTNKDFEIARIQEAAALLEANKDRAPIIRTPEQVENPLGKLDDVTLIITADDHHPPSQAIEGTRSYAFARYVLERVLMGIPQLKTQEKRWGEFPVKNSNLLKEIIKIITLGPLREKIKLFKKPPGYRDNSETPGDAASFDNADLLSSDVLVRQYIEWHEIRQLFDQWLVKLISSEEFRKTETNQPLAANTETSQPVIISMGDKIHGGAFFLDQIDVELQYLNMLDAIEHKNSKLKPLLMSLFGNHDQDGRIPDAIGLQTELFGQRIFTQDVGNVRIVALDTNIESESWLKVFKSYANAEQLEALKQKQALQEVAIQKMLEHSGPVLLLTHHPARAVEAFGVKRKILQRSNVQKILSGHIHKEAHLSTPMLNQAGQRIELHALESVSRSKDGKPIPPKAYAIRIDGNSIGEVRTMQQNPGDFANNHQEQMTAHFTKPDIKDEQKKS